MLSLSSLLAFWQKQKRYFAHFVDGAKNTARYTRSMSSPAILIGTSGWHYADWYGRFYPPAVKASEQLAYYARQFPAVEINSSFYHPPRLETVQHWAEIVPPEFQFSVKLYRYLTHTKHLNLDAEAVAALHAFFDTLAPLRGQLAAVLVQLPPGLAVDNGRLRNLAEQVQVARVRLGLELPLAIEFRHASWFNDQTFELMHQYRIANVISDTPGRWPMSYAVTAELVYIRLHGNRRLYSSSYTQAELTEWYEFMQTQVAEGRRVLCFFDNTSKAVAPHNAQTVLRLMEARAEANRLDL